jgi:YggT family protein
MTILGAIGIILHQIIFVYTWVIIISALISFVQPNPYNPVVQTLERLTNPVYRRLRRYVPTIFGGVDLAPLIIIIALNFIDLAFIIPLANSYNG